MPLSSLRRRVISPVIASLIGLAGLGLAGGGAGFTLALSGLALYGVSAPVHAALFEDDEARKAILDLRAKLNEQGRQLDNLSRQVNDLSTRIEQRVEPALRGQLETQNQIESMRQEIARLRGALEVQTNEVNQLKAREKDSLADIDSRLKRFEPTQIQLDGRTVAVDPNDKRVYEAALAQFRSGDFRAAQSSFQQFISGSPESPYVPSAMFWLGSAQFAQKDYRSAIATHQSFLAKFPDHPRVPDVLLNLAYAQIESGDRKSARRSLDTVIAKYPGTTAGQAARDRLASLK